MRSNTKNQQLYLMVIMLLQSAGLISACVYVDENQLKQQGIAPTIQLESNVEFPDAPIPFTMLERELFRAVESNDLQRAEELLHRGANLSALNEQQKSLYEVALEANMLPIIDELISNGTPIHGGETYYYAITHNKTPILKMLLHYGNVNQRCRDGSTPLMAAIAQGDPEIVKLLLDNGADPLFADIDGRLPIDTANDKDNKAGLPDVDYNYAQIRSLLINSY